MPESLERIVDRIWSRDATLWKREDAHRRIIENALGWLPIVDELRTRISFLRDLAEDVRANFSDVVVLGMGGSSLCPEVLRRSIGSAPGFPRLHVLDSTVPAAVARLEETLNLSTTLFIVASKSGTTVEPRMFYRYFRGRVDDGAHFMAITDPATQLEREAVADRFRHVVLNPSDIGGRYSALSNFGMVPAAFLGIDLETFLERAAEAVDASRYTSEEGNAPAELGEAIARNALEGRDKLTLVVSPPIDSLALWIEQLVAESTGKEGKGVLPVAGERLGEPEDYGQDRLFVWIHAGEDALTRQKLTRLQGAGHPVLERNLRDVLDLGAEFFVWEFATAVAGAILGINPFDQPNVQESKDNTVRLLQEFVANGRFDEPPFAPVESVREHLRSVRTGDYVAITQYIAETPEHDALLSEIQETISTTRKVATTTGYGPRFLHSTGQLHKGGADNGVFIQLLSEGGADLVIPGEPFGFAALAKAQALGDYQALQSRGRRAIRINLGPDAEAGLRALRAAL
jgi:transaldolase / glucose-6-phosphate isomerase